MPSNWALAVLGATAYATNAASYRWASYLIDSPDNEAWQAADTPVTGKAVWFDLGAARWINRFRFKQHTNPIAAATSVRIATSPNGTDWTTLADVALSVGDQYVDLDGAMARWWRFTALVGGSGQWEVNTVELIGEETEPPDPITTVVPPANTQDCPSMAAWLTGLETYYVECVEAWLQENGYWPVEE